MTAMLESAVQTAVQPSADAITPSLTTWKIDPAHTHVEFAVRHMMIATVKGRFADVDGTIAWDQADSANSAFEVVIPVAGIDTKQPDRDAHLRSADFFDAENHPALTFRSTRIEPKGESDFTAYGELTIRGVTREVALEGELLGTGKSPYGFTVAGFSARTKINRKDYGLNWNAALETGGVLVGDEVKITLEVEAIQQG